MYKLIIQDDEGKTTIVPLIRDEITIGRREGNTIRLTERNVSRRHARILRASGALIVEDLDSYNGVRVNGSRVQGRSQVGEADRIQIGDYLLELKLERAAQAIATATTLRPQTVPPASGNGERVASGISSPVPFAPEPTAIMRLPLDDQPTRPYSAPATTAGPVVVSPEYAPPGAVPTAGTPYARMVVTSTNLAGREFSLQKTETVLGRTNENDIALDHRSISRHHAKVILEQGRYVIIDMQSANGLRVNGEEYGRVELRAGDEVDLGHVRLRFIGPGEDFVFARDATVIDIARVAPRRLLRAWWPVFTLGAVGTVLGAALLLRGGAPSDKSKPVVPSVGVGVVATGGGPDAAGALVVHPGIVTPDAGKSGVTDEPVVLPGVETIDTMLVAARRAAVDQRWSEVTEVTHRALAIASDNAEAQRLSDLAEREAKNYTTWQNFQKAARGQRVADAKRLASQIPDDSVYRERAMKASEDLESKVAGEMVDEARQYARAGQCAKLAAVQRRVQAMAPELSGEVDDLARTCKAPVIDGGGEAPSGEYSVLFADLKKTYQDGHFVKALARAEELLKIRPGDPGTLSFAVFAACKAGKAERARIFAASIKDPSRLHAVKSVCYPLGIKF
ncbi:MAG: FHA domain-containing protein [Myxococcales bacterium]|nr:FHA domain-containing protein [Myxococcales bacterium]